MIEYPKDDDPEIVGWEIALGILLIMLIVIALIF